MPPVAARPANNYTYDGSTINDIVIAADCKSVQLRDERDTTQNGRIYKVYLRIIGNSSAAGMDAVYTVVLSNQGAAVIDSGGIIVSGVIAGRKSPMVSWGINRGGVTNWRRLFVMAEGSAGAQLSSFLLISFHPSIANLCDHQLRK